MDSSLIRAAGSLQPRIRWAGTLALGLGVFLGTLSAEAGPILTYAGKTVRWNITATSAPLNVFIDASAASLTTSISEALNEWSNVSGSFLRLTTTGSQASAQIVIGVGALSNGFSAGYATPAYTTNGDLVSCTVTLGSNALTAASDEARMLVLHEVGHCLGLVHSTIRNAVMSYRDAASHLTDDDQLSLVRLYPSDGSQDLPLGCATVEAPSSSGPGSFTHALTQGAWFLILLGLAGWQTRPQRRLAKSA